MAFPMATTEPARISDESCDRLQLSLFDALVEITSDPDELIEDRFERFHQANPHVFREIVRLAREAKERGMRHWSINGVFEVLRWVRQVETMGDAWKLNNSFRALYARKVMDRCPDLDGFFELRRRPSEEE